MVQNLGNYLDSLQAKFSLSGYITKDTLVQKVNGHQIQTVTYQGEHEDEYLVSEMENGVMSGRVQLFHKGILQMSWTIEKGRYIGIAKMYERGKVKSIIPMSFFTANQHRMFEDSKHGMQMVITDISNRVVVYRGAYNDRMEKEGRGLEYDWTTGRVLICGMYVKDQLVHVIQEFESSTEMIEYTDGEEDNTSIMTRRPVYIGGYVYDEDDCMYKRNGIGMEIDEDSGIACRESVWRNSVEEVYKGNDLESGWYVKNKLMDESMRIDLTKFMVGCSEMEISNKNDLESIPWNVTKLVVTDNCCNEASIVKFDMRQFSRLRSIKVGKDSFKYVNIINIKGLNLSEVKIGTGSFSSVKEINPKIKVNITNQKNLSELNGFVDDLVFASNCCNELDLTDLDLSGFYWLKSILIGSNSLMNVLRLDMKGLILNKLKIEEGALKKIKELIMKYDPTVIEGDIHYTAHDENEIRAIPLHISSLVFAENSCNDTNLQTIDIRNLMCLKSIVIESNSLMNIVKFEANWNTIITIECDDNGLKNLSLSILINNRYDFYGISRILRTLSINNMSCNESDFTELDLCGYPLLTVFEVGNESLIYVKRLIINELKQLKTVYIGEKSFTLAKNWTEEQKDCEFHLTNCSSLVSLEIGRSSFSDYYVFNLHDLNCLKSIKIGDQDKSFCFKYTPVVDFVDMPELETIELGRGSFYECHSVRFESMGGKHSTDEVDLPLLRSITLHQNALYGDGRSDRKRIDTEPYRYKNSLIMKDLPLLRSLYISEYCFYAIGSVTLENITSLSIDGIYCRSKRSAQNVYKLQSSNADALDSFICSKAKWI